MNENTGKKAKFKRHYTDPETNIFIPAGTELPIINQGEQKIECQTAQCPISVSREVVEII